MKKIIKVAIIIVGFIVLSCAEKEVCPNKEVTADCGGSNTKPKVDLVVLIDTSGSMGLAANAISTEAASAISNALKTCDSDFRVVYLGLEGIWSGTNFIQTSRSYLSSLPGFTGPLAIDRPVIGYSSECGANGIEDISKYFDWRAGSCRAIFYISDEELDGCSPRADYVNEDSETNAAIVEAKKDNVAVFLNFLTYQNLGPRILTNYTDLASQTGGSLFVTPTSSIPANYYTTNKIFDNIVCNACNGCD